MLRKNVAAAEAKTFPANACVRLSINGLAFCKLKPEISKISFLSHVPFHQLDMKITQKRRDSETPIFELSPIIESGHTISIKTENAVMPGSISTDGAFPLSELVNITELHKRKINYKKGLPAKLPVILTVNDCAFYTEQVTPDEFDLIETDETGREVTVARRKIGYAMGGVIKCSDTSGDVTIEVKGAHSIKTKRPLSDADGDFIYDIYFSNHCSDDQMDNCRDLMKTDSDFRFYYDVLEDSKNPNRKFKLKKAPLTGKPRARSIDTTACNVIIVEPPNTP